MYKIGIITASDKGAQGQREDKSWTVIREMVSGLPAEVCDYRLLPDEPADISAALAEMAGRGLDLIFTTGGTGLGPRDHTPEATLAVVDRLVPGLAELMRQKGLEQTPRAALSRAVAGIRGRSLIINLPGSPRAVRESLEALLPVLPHALEILTGSGGECARPDTPAPADPAGR